MAIHQIAGSDPKAINTFERPDTIVSRDLGGEVVTDGRLTLQLPPLSFTAVVTAGYGEGR
jgi:alpha-N-arabinofuranosidase